MTTAEQFICTPVPANLYHYTSVNALKGILSSHCMWATDASFMNDTTELTHALPVVKDVVAKFDYSSVPEIRQFVDRFVSDEYEVGFLSKQRSQYFLLSFTLLADDLSQWRSYADEARGVCIELDLRQLKPPQSMDTMVTFAPCEYDSEKQSALVDSVVSSFVERHKRLIHVVDDAVECANQWALWQVANPTKTLADFRAVFPRNMIIQSVAKFRSELVRLCCHFKSHHFSSEQEWRLVLPHLRDQEFKRTTFREQNGKPIVEFTFEGFDKLPISSIRLGPLTDENRVKEILAEAEYRVPVTRSVIPYRDTRLA